VTPFAQLLLFLSKAYSFYSGPQIPRTGYSDQLENEKGEIDSGNLCHPSPTNKTLFKLPIEIYKENTNPLCLSLTKLQT
jgi:hypothetical protein